MPYFDSDGVRLHYAVSGPEQGRPIVLVHGFASDYELNWVGSRWQETLTGAGFRVLGLDLCGHGRSDKPHDATRYTPARMTADVTRLLDHMDAGTVDYLGYSMGARIGLEMAVHHGPRLDRVVLGGIGGSALEGNSHRAELIARRLRGDQSVDDPRARMFYEFASARPANDLEALACCIVSMQGALSEEDLGSIRVPVAVIAGDQDDLARRAPDLAAAIPGARYAAIVGRNHMNAVPAHQFKREALAFLESEILT